MTKRYIAKHIGISVATMLLFPLFVLIVAKWTAFLMDLPLDPEARHVLVGLALSAGSIFALTWSIEHLLNWPNYD
jgi:hypothetical protein